MLRLLLLLLAIVGCGFYASGQDWVALASNDTLHGEIKSMNRGVLQIETSYSASDLKIEWEEVIALYSSRFFTFSLSDGTRLAGSFQMAEDGQSLIITDETGQPIRSALEHVVYIKQIDRDFWSRLSASVDLGFSYAKTNNLVQFNGRSTLGYLTEKWQLDFSFNSVQSKQDNVADVLRRETKTAYSYFLPGKWWFVQGSFGFLTNTEQLLDLRTTSKLGLGSYFIQTNTAYWGYGFGLASNIERFSTGESENRSTAELYVGTEWNLFDGENIKVQLSLVTYTGVTESGRFRADGAFDFKYDLPLDFYIGIGASLNYDNRPVEVEGIRGQETDYVTTLNFGWSL